MPKRIWNYPGLSADKAGNASKMAFRQKQEGTDCSGRSCKNKTERRTFAFPFIEALPREADERMRKIFA